MTSVTIERAGPLTTIQDAGRCGMLRHGVSASGPMDRAAYRLAGALCGAGNGGIEFTRAGLACVVDCEVAAGFAGGDFKVQINGKSRHWPGTAMLTAGDHFEITPGTWGNYGYLRFGGGLLLKRVGGSIATSSRAQLGGLDGRALQKGDVIGLDMADVTSPIEQPAVPLETGAFRVIWGLHADRFTAAVRTRFLASAFTVSPRLDRMGVRLLDAEGVFADAQNLSLVSDAIVPGDIQIMGDGTPIVLMRDHQPTGGYPRIATIIDADLDRFAQLRPGSAIALSSVTVNHAHSLLRSHR